jgi:hypothetical protein
MKVFNGRAATEEYMSTHSLTFSTPEMTLKKFVFWLGDQVDRPENKEQVPRLMLYIEEKTNNARAKMHSDLMPDVDDSFRPSGAVTDMYNSIAPTEKDRQPMPAKEVPNLDAKFCLECGCKLKSDSKFCKSCGARQE